jgi:2-octaprenyl-6-methoxyphenol hydroxylase
MPKKAPKKKPEKKPENTDMSVDIAIAGGGMAGMTLGCGLAANGFSVAVVDPLVPKTQLDETFDGRASAITYSAYKMLDALGIWPLMAKSAEPICEIHVTDADAPVFLHFDHRDLGEGPLGYMVENRHNRFALFERAKKLKGLHLIAPDKVNSMEAAAGEAAITLESGGCIKAKLVVAAEGRRSPLREAANIPLSHWSYNQSGIVATISHELEHRGVAHERFLTEGPFAILPLANNRSSLVWSTKTSLVDTIMGLSERAIEAEIAKRVGGFLGEIKITGPRWSYPLALQYAHRYTDDRLVLVGDSAHGMHPIAGQGLNLGYRDIAVLIEVLVDARAIGADIGSAQVLSNYERWRRTDTVSLLAVTDILTRLFSNNIGPIRLARDIGLGVVDQVAPLKRFFMRHARGTVGKLPKLLKGEAF